MRIYKVCHISSVHKRLDVRIFHKECLSLSNNYYDVSLIIDANNEDISYAKKQNINIIKLYPVSGRVRRILLQNYKCYREALKLNSDIYHFHDPEFIPFGVLLKLRGKTVIYDVHEDVPMDIYNKDWIPLVARRIISRLTYMIEHISAKYFLYIISATPHILDRFRKANKKAININNYPLKKDIPDEVKFENRNAYDICYIGGITKKRGLEEVLIALESLESNIKINLAGNFLDKKFEDKLKNLDTWNNVNFYGYVGRDEIRTILSRSSIGIVTLHPTKTYIDSLPVKMFEYMAYGMPVIASDFPLWRKIIKKYDCGILVNPESPKEIAHAINHLTANKELAIKMGKNARKAILEEYNWQVEEDKLINFYRTLV